MFLTLWAPSSGHNPKFLRQFGSRFQVCPAWNVSKIIWGSPNVRNKSSDDIQNVSAVSNWRQVRKVSSEDWTQLKWQTGGWRFKLALSSFWYLKRQKQIQLKDIDKDKDLWKLVRVEITKKVFFTKIETILAFCYL